jgi:hypothetical protein
MAINGRQKGANFELDVAWFVSMWWWGTPRVLRRTPMSGGWSKTSASGDLISELDPFPFSVECKFSVGWHMGELFNPGWGMLGDYWKQCIGDATHQRKIPMLCFKTNGSPIYVMMERQLFSCIEDKHTRVQTRDHRDVGVVVMRLKEDLFKSYGLGTIYQAAMASDDVYTWDVFQKMRTRAQEKFPPKPGDLKDMEKFKAQFSPTCM